ncbi:MAG: hypothetical protein WCK54_13490 [Desulfuromonadales bacterium]
MNKAIDEDTATDHDYVINPELLFCNDALVVDYLNALLASQPTLNMDFREIHFVHQEITSNGKANTIVANAMCVESKNSKTEADVLRSENENLKFKTELASIDAQVLRKENNKLKMEKELLFAQLSEINIKLNTVQAENESLRQAAETGRHQLGPPAISIEDQTQNTHTDITNCSETAMDENIAADSEHTDQCRIQEQDMQTELVAVTTECCNDCKISIPTDQERSIISGVTVPNNSAITVTALEVTILSREKGSGGISHRNVRSLSKVLKHHPAEINHTKRTGHIQKAASLDAVQRENKTAAVDRSPNFAQQQHSVAAEVANSQESDTSASYAALPQFKDADEITMPDAPTPKVVIRRNVKNYEDLQKESDSIKTAETGHSSQV